MNYITIKSTVIIILITVITLTFNLAVIQADTSFNLIYVVQQNDTLSEIARDYGVSTSRLRETNDISPGEFIRMGQELKIPRPETKEPELNYSLSSPFSERKYQLDTEGQYPVRIDPKNVPTEIDIPEDQIITYHVGMGDTLYELAEELNTSIGVIMALNDMESSVIHSGDTIRLPINNLNPRQALARTVNDRDLDLMARAIYGEARGEPFLGQVAVGAVIINRVLSDFFPDSFEEVIYQSGQFSAVDDGQIDLTPTETAYDAAHAALEGEDPTMGSLYYYNPQTARDQGWFDSRRSMVTIGDHVFVK
ncbi:MAG: cell wall hydrolase [Halanaerobiales bacterium]